MKSSMSRSIRAGVMLTSVLVCVPISAQETKVTLEELIAHHLDAIGTVQARAAVRNRVVAGPVNLVSRIGTATNMNGQAAMAFSGVKLRYSLRFPSPQYPGEQLGYDGSKILTGSLPGGQRSALSLYLQQQGLPLREGLLGGTVSTAWTMLRLDQLKPRLDYRGLKKIDGRQLYEVGYRAQKGSSDLKVTLFFEAETFRHVRSEYEFKIGARLGNGPNESSKSQEDYYKLVEDFDDFRTADGLTVPRKYRLRLQLQTSRGSNLFDWNIAIDQVLHNQTLDEQIFSK